MFFPARRTFAYTGLLGAAFAIALVASWTPVGTEFDNSFYDWTFRLYRPQPWKTESIILAIDEPSLQAFSGRLGLRNALAKSLRLLESAPPKAIAIDSILADPGVDREAD